MPLTRASLHQDNSENFKQLADKSPFFAAVLQKKSKTLNRLLSQSQTISLKDLEKVHDLQMYPQTDANLASEDGDTLLILASWQGDMDSVKTLVCAKANIHAKNSAGYSALAVAALKGFSAIASYLIECGANLMESIEKNETPLSFATQSMSPHVTQLVQSYYQKQLEIEKKKHAEQLAILERERKRMSLVLKIANNDPSVQEYVLSEVGLNALIYRNSLVAALQTNRVLHTLVIQGSRALAFLAEHFNKIQGVNALVFEVRDDVEEDVFADAALNSAFLNSLSSAKNVERLTFDGPFNTDILKTVLAMPHIRTVDFAHVRAKVDLNDRSLLESIANSKTLINFSVKVCRIQDLTSLLKACNAIAGLETLHLQFDAFVEFDDRQIDVKSDKEFKQAAEGKATKEAILVEQLSQLTHTEQATNALCTYLANTKTLVKFDLVTPFSFSSRGSFGKDASKKHQVFPDIFTFKKICGSLCKNRTIQFLNFTANHFSLEHYQALIDLVTENPHVQEIGWFADSEYRSVDTSVLSPKGCSFEITHTIRSLNNILEKNQSLQDLINLLKQAMDDKKTRDEKFQTIIQKAALLKKEGKVYDVFWILGNLCQQYHMHPKYVKMAYDNISTDDLELYSRAKAAMGYYLLSLGGGSKKTEPSHPSVGMGVSLQTDQEGAVAVNADKDDSGSRKTDLTTSMSLDDSEPQTEWARTSSQTAMMATSNFLEASAAMQMTSTVNRTSSQELKFKTEEAELAVATDTAANAFMSPFLLKSPGNMGIKGLKCTPEGVMGLLQFAKGSEKARIQAEQQLQVEQAKNRFLEGTKKEPIASAKPQDRSMLTGYNAIGIKRSLSLPADAVRFEQESVANGLPDTSKAKRQKISHKGKA